MAEVTAGADALANVLRNHCFLVSLFGTQLAQG